MLPHLPPFAREHIAGPWLQHGLLPLPSISGLPAEAQAARGADRQRGDSAELRSVTVPASARPGRIFDRQHLLQAIHLDACEFGRSGTPWQESGRQRRGLLEPAAVES